jgi:hypothetical protein
MPSRKAVFLFGASAVLDWVHQKMQRTGFFANVGCSPIKIKSNYNLQTLPSGLLTNDKHLNHFLLAKASTILSIATTLRSWQNKRTYRL